MTKITAIIPTFNEESNIQRALDSVHFADEIIVIDSFSTDKTVDIVKKSSAKLIKRKFDDFSSQKNYAIQQATHNWIFLLDADEEVTPSLEKEVLKTVDTNTNFVAFYVYRNFFFRQTKLGYSGWQRDKVIRLFKKDCNFYQGKVHEKIISKGAVGFLKNRLNHYSYKNYFQYRNKLEKYAKLQATELYQREKIVTLYHLLLKPFIRFFIHVFIKLGILDGWRGLLISFLHSYGVFMRYIELLKVKFITPILENKKKNIRVFNSLNENKKDVSIIIVNYKSWHHLDRCLNSLAKVIQEKFTFKVTVVDNFSNDGKLKTFVDKYPNVVFIENTGNNGFANGCNVGAKNATSDYYLFLNPDTIVNKKALDEMFYLAKKNKDCWIVSCMQKKLNGSYEKTNRVFPNIITLFGLTRSIGKIFKKKKSYKNIIFPDWVSGSVVFIKKEWFNIIGGWNEDFWMYFEDVDLCKKVNNAKKNVALLKNVEVVHNHGGASRINIKTAALTKSEVLISKHVYVQHHFTNMAKISAQILLVLQVLIVKIIVGLFGFILFFIPKLRLQWYILINMVRYYFYAINNKTWLSPRSINKVI